MQSYPVSNALPRGFGTDLAPYRNTYIRNRRLLVAEDDRDVWPLIQIAGSAIGRDVTIAFAGDVDEAIDRMIETPSFDAVLVDYCLPDAEDGKGLRRAVESILPGAEVAMMSSAIELKSNGGLFLPKPFTPAQCEQLLRCLLD